jgi:hypothetical protein
MTAVMHEMIEVLRRDNDFDVAANLRSQDNGLRLAAVAFLNANPDPWWAGELAQAALAEDKPFNGYWAYRTLRQIVAGHCEALDEVTRRRLNKAFLDYGPALTEHVRSPSCCEIAHVNQIHRSSFGQPAPD